MPSRLTVCSRVNAGFLGVDLARLSKAVVCSQALLTWGPLLWVTFDLCHALTLAHPNSSPSVNEFEDPHTIVSPECLLVKGW